MILNIGSSTMQLSNGRFYKKSLKGIHFILSFYLSVFCVAEANSLDSRVMLPDFMQDNLRFSVDLSARGIYDSEADTFSHIEAVGFDMHKVFSGLRGDIGTLLLQGYLTRINNLESHPPFFDDDNDWEFVFRIFNFNYKVLPQDRLNFRIGHFEIPFGLEHVINTNGTLRDYLHGQNLGVKADWGISVNGSLPLIEYEISASRGSGNAWESRGDPYVFAGRVGTHNNRNIVVGVSAMEGDVYSRSSPGEVVDRNRVGLDLRWYLGRYGVFAEHSIGEDEGSDVKSSLVELNFTNSDAAWLSYVQYITVSRDTASGHQNRNTALKAGIKWDWSRRWDVSAQVSHDINKSGGAPESNIFAAQIRYRF